MISSIRAGIAALVAPNHRLSCARTLWHAGLLELRKRGGGRRESGAFLLGTSSGGRRRVERFAYYDDLDPGCLDGGIVEFDGAGYGPLWQLCRESGLQVVADVHTHPGRARQSVLDRDNPMIATKGHVALIVPDYAQHPFTMEELGVYEYEGAHAWTDHCGAGATDFFYVGLFG